MVKLIAGIRVVALLAPGALLALFGLLHFRNGLVVDRSYPIFLLLETDASASKVKLSQAANILLGASALDGHTQLLRAQAQFRAGRPQAPNLQDIRAAVTRSPISSSGWLTYGEAILPFSMKESALFLAQSFILAPFDYFETPRRLALASQVWDALSEETQQAALRRVRELWEEPSMRPGLLMVLRQPRGGQIVAKAFFGDAATIRAMNRWVAAYERAIQPASH